MRSLDYQTRVLDTLDAYLDALGPEKAKADKAAALIADNPDLGITLPDFPAKAWEAMQAAGKLPILRKDVPFSPRADGCARAVPNVTFKVPTGGGKTFLAVNAVSRITSRYLNKNTGFVLWIVPNEAIYSQTLKHLKNRQHPYRQTLDRAGAGRVKIMEKGDRLDKRDVESNLCVMILMLQSANRQTNEALRMFKDRGDVHGFFPPEGDQLAQKAAFEATPNLDGYDQDMFPMVKDSLGNALRMIRPIVVMDEGQKATSDLAHKTLYGFNPVFVLELTATPKDIPERTGPNHRAARYANLLVEVTGRELHAEDMIKMPLNLDPRQGLDWRATLAAGVAKLNEVDSAAKVHRGETGRYIRPIMLVQVERTGKDQRDGAHIHSDDVREWLLQTGFDEAEVAIKTAEKNDLNQPENLDLMSPTNRVRVIITKAALQEGWDCPFAYVLCSLAASSNQSAMTQLVGRILRQPYATKTKVGLLDECHIITHHADTKTVVSKIKSGLESEGLADLVIKLGGDTTTGGGGTSRKVERRDTFKSKNIYLPSVLCLENNVPRPLDYETDLLAQLDWRAFDPAKIIESIPDSPDAVEAQLQRITFSGEDADEAFSGNLVGAAQEQLQFDASYAVRSVSDIVLNPFVGREIVGNVIAGLRKRGFDDAKLGQHASFIIEQLRRGLEAERAERSEQLFKKLVAAGTIQFRLRLDGENWRMPDQSLTSVPEGERVLRDKNDGPLQCSLFAPIYEKDLNTDERNVAIQLDGHAAVTWWHRNVAMASAGYGLQGWRRGRIYPDFIFATEVEGGNKRLVALETKGDHLQNLDTEYKREVMEFLSDNFQWDQSVKAGQLTLTATGETVECVLILMQDIKNKLPDLIAPSKTS